MVSISKDAWSVTQRGRTSGAGRAPAQSARPRSTGGNALARLCATAAATAIWAIASSATAGIATETVLAQWDFNGQTLDATSGIMASGSTLTTIGGVSGATFASGGGSSDPTQPGFGWQTSGYPGQGTGHATAGIEFRVSTIGYHDVSVRWDLRPSNTASRWSMLLVSVDGGNTFEENGTFESTSGSAWFTGIGASLSGVAGVADNAEVIFRVVSVYGPNGFGYDAAQAGSTYGGGTWRFDMITVEGSSIAIPVPATASLLAVAGALSMRRRRR